MTSKIVIQRGWLIIMKKTIGIILIITLLMSSFTVVSFGAETRSSGTVLANSKIESNSKLGINSKIDKQLKKAGYRSILIMGVDDGGRCDLLIVLVLKKNKSGKYDGKIVSIARDSYFQMLDAKGKGLKIDGRDRTYGRANLAYSNGGMNIAMKTLNRNLDLNIKECIAVDWQCAADMITILNKTQSVSGSIKNQSMLNGINELIRGHGKTTELSKPNKFPATVALLGWQAVEYLRVRKYDDGAGSKNMTIDRDNRNRTMFRLIFSIAKKLSPEARRNVFYQLASELDTNMGLDSMNQVEKITKIDDGGSWPVKGKYHSLWDPAGGHSVRVPTTLLSNVQTLHKKLYPGVKYKPSKTVKNISKKLAWRDKNFLKKEGTFTYADISVPAATYNGKAWTPSPSISMSGISLREGTDYTIGSYSNNTNVGMASFTITGKGNYEGTSKRIYFPINPLGTSLTSIAPAKKAFSVSWNEQAATMSSSRITGYQIQYSTNKAFKKGNKTATVKGYSTTSTTIKKLKKKKRYYVRVRTYMKVGGNTCYSAWSPVKSVKTKK